MVLWALPFFIMLSWERIESQMSAYHFRLEERVAGQSESLILLMPVSSYPS